MTVRTGGVSFEAARTIALDFTGGSATAGEDFTVADGGGNALTAPYTLTLAAGGHSASATITAVDDHAVDAGEAIAIAARLGETQLGMTRTIAIADDDEAGVTVAPGELEVVEGGEAAAYTVVLASEPAAAVTVTVEGAGTEVTVSPSRLTFTAGDWDRTQTVTVAAPEDPDTAGAEVILTHAVESGDADYAGAAAEDVSVVVTDNDAPGVTVAPGELEVAEGESDDLHRGAGDAARRRRDGVRGRRGRREPPPRRAHLHRRELGQRADGDGERGGRRRRR